MVRTERGSAADPRRLSKRSLAEGGTVTVAAKLGPPKLPRGLVPRPALLERLDTALERRLTTIVGGPGSGKSTLVAEWASYRDVAWYTVDGADASLAALARGLEDALRMHRPRLAASVSAAVGGSPALGREESEQAEPLAALLVQELEEELDADLVLVLDDVEELRAGSASARFVAALVRQAPPQLHVLLCGRANPPFPIERLRGRGQLLSIEGALLAFSRAEIEELLSRARLLETSLAQRIQALTGGWPAAVRLTLEALQAVRQDQLATVLDRLPRRGSPLFAYLAEEVFAQALPEVRHLLRTAARFERFNADLCEFLGVARAQETLESLADRGLFVYAQAGGDGWFSLHGLVREFALDRWPLERGEALELSRRAAEWLGARGLVSEALLALISAGDRVTITAFLDDHGEALVAAGAAADVLRAAEVIPVEGREPRIDEVVGDAYALGGEWEEALACYGRAAQGDEPPRAALAWRLGRIHWDRGELDEALAEFSRGRLDGSDPVAESLLLSWTAMCRWARGEPDLARALGEQAIALAQAMQDDRALAAAHNVLMLTWLGPDSRKAEQHGRQGLEAAERAGDVLQRVRILLNLTGAAEPAGAIEMSEEALRLAELTGAGAYIAAALLTRGMKLRELCRFEDAASDLARARSLLERLGSRRLARALANLAVVHELRGDIALARKLYSEALPIAERSHDAQDEMGIAASLAKIVVRDDPAAARGLAERAVSIVRSLRFQLAEVLVPAGWVALASGDRHQASLLADEALAAAEGDRFALALSLELKALSASNPRAETALLEEAASLRRALGDPRGTACAELAVARLQGSSGSLVAERAQRKLRRLGVRTSASAVAGLLMAVGPDQPAPLEIETLGGFRVLRDGQPVALVEWQSRKAREALKVLIARRGHPTPRDVLLETLWPGEDPSKSGPRLSVALSKIRAVLDPERRFPPEHYLVSERDLARLDLDHVGVDVQRFLNAAGEALATEGPDAQELLETAEAAYAGDFLEEDLYEDWSAALREEARAAYVAVAKVLAKNALARGDPESSARYRRRMLERDRYDEGAHLGLISALLSSDRHGEARRAYRNYVARMEEIGVEPAPFAAATPALAASPT